MSYPTSNANLNTSLAGSTAQAGVHAQHHDQVATEINAIEADLLPGGALRAAIDAKAAGSHTHPEGDVTSGTGGLPTDLSNKASTNHHATHQSGGADAITGTLDGNARVAVTHGGASVGTRRAINLIDGTNVTLTVADNAAQERVDVTVASAGGTGGTGYATMQENGSALTQRAALNFQDGVVASDNAGSTRTDVSVAYAGTGAALTVARSDHTHADPLTRGATVINPTVRNYDLGVIRKAGTLANVFLKCADGTSATLNLRKNGTTTLLTAAQTVAAGSAPTTVTGATLQNTALAVGDWIEAMVTAISGVVTEVVVQFEWNVSL